MTYALNLAADGRVLSATYERFAYPNAVIVEVLPRGDISEYRYKNGQFMYDPLPIEVVPSVPTEVERITTLENRQAAQDAQIAYIGMMTEVL